MVALPAAAGVLSSRGAAPVPPGREVVGYAAAARATASAPAGSRMGQAGSVAARQTASATSREWVTGPPAWKRAVHLGRHAP